jgi:hypothetical protein
VPQERVLVDVVRENELAVDLDRGQELAVARLEQRVARDVDGLEVEVGGAAQVGQLRQGALAEVATGGVVDDDARSRYG